MPECYNCKTDIPVRQVQLCDKCTTALLIARMHTLANNCKFCFYDETTGKNVLCPKHENDASFVPHFPEQVRVDELISHVAHITHTILVSKDQEIQEVTVADKSERIVVIYKMKGLDNDAFSAPTTKNDVVHSADKSDRKADRNRR